MDDNAAVGHGSSTNTNAERMVLIMNNGTVADQTSASNDDGGDEPLSAARIGQNGSPEEDPEDEFCEFTSFDPVANEDEDQRQDEDEFADFASFTPAGCVDPPPPPTAAPTRQLGDIGPRGLIWEAFGAPSQFAASGRLAADFFHPQACSEAGSQLWSSLQQIYLQLSFDKWRQSATFRHLLESLKIDPRNVIPPDIFPTSSYLSRERITLRPIPQAVPLPPESAEAGADHFPAMFGPSSPGPDSTRHTRQQEEEESVTGAADLARNLDLFETKYVQDSKQANDLVAELDAFLLSPAPKPSANPQVLSAEALQILHELPDVSMVRTKILMFPSRKFSNL